MRAASGGRKPAERRVASEALAALKTRKSSHMSNIRRDQRQRARRQLFWAAGVFVLVQQVACLLLDYRWPEVRFPWAHERFHAAGGDVKPDIVYLGSSRLLTT